MLRLHDGLDFYAHASPETPFATDGAHSITWAQASSRADLYASALARDEIGHGDRFAYLSKNSLDMAVMYFAASRLGAVPVPLNYRLAPPEWVQILRDAQCRLVIASSEYAATVDGVAADLPGVSRWITLGDAGPGSRWISQRSWMPSVAEKRQTPTVTAEDIVYQMYTSGTTGVPKGVLLSHANVLTCALQVLMAQNYRPAPGDFGLVVGPMYHASGVFPLVVAALTGMSLRIETQFDPARAADALSGGVAWAVLVPVMIKAVLDVVESGPPRSFERLRMIFYGAAPMPESLLARAFRIFGCQLGQGFGQTESSACLTFLTHADHQRALQGKTHLLGSVGRALPATEIRIEDIQGRVLPPGEAGEIVVRGPQVMRGYWNAPEKTAETVRDGWLHTGDVGTMDSEGYVYIQDRLKDMVVTGGSNVYSIEVERVLQEHPAVAEVAVIGVPDPEWGESVLAVVVPKAGATVTLEALREFGRTRLGGYKLPRRMDISQALPRNPSGKILKHVLREPYWAGHAKRVA
jgi:acyl-CoA synthetase (AMP-forming)/AMP-acid ligase II